jgi:Raf kinase inhibitor-like YbhB/YbcL family protein
MKAAIASHIVAICIVAFLSNAWGQTTQWGGEHGDHKLQVSSTTFSNNGTLPLSMVWDQCTDYPGGGNVSPELTWNNAPHETRSFIVTMYDVTAAFTHWGMYNISSKATRLPSNAGVAGSTYGVQVLNDYFIAMSYDGPCPPPALNPPTHQYVFTVYALDVMLPQLPTFGDFAAGPEALYHALIAAALSGHILDSASISGFFGGQ